MSERDDTAPMLTNAEKLEFDAESVRLPASGLQTAVRVS